MKIALVLLFLTAMVALPGSHSWGIRFPRVGRIIRTVGRVVRRTVSTVVNTGKKIASTVKKVGQAIKSGKRDVSEFDVDGDGEVSDDEIMTVLATRDVEDLVQDGYITEADKGDISHFQRQVREAVDPELE